MRWLIALAFLLTLPLHSLPASANSPTAQAKPVITPLEPASQFGEQITFRVRVEPVDNVKELIVYITPEGQSAVWQRISLKQNNPDGEYIQAIKARQLVLFPFSKVTYRFEVLLKDNKTKISSNNLAFVYEDNRFVWQSLKSGLFQIYWNSEDTTLGHEIANIAQEGLTRGQQILDIEPPELMRIYAYSKASDLQEALQLTSQPWVAGHATPELAMMMISIPSGPEKTLELRRQIPHEIMHIMQYQVMEDSFTQQPVWLVEGMASLTELTDNPEYRAVLKATQPDAIIHFEDLCIMFPKQAAPAYQAYAQSQSFVSFLQQKFGTSGLLKLVDAYKNGVGCQEGVSTAFGFSLRELEYRWKQETLGINASELAFSNLGPYLVLGLLIMAPAAAAFFRPRKPDPEEE